MSSKLKILKAIREQVVAASELPGLDGAWIRYDDALAQFQRMVQSVGGRCLRVSRLADVGPALESVPHFSAEAQVVSNVEGVKASIDLDQVEDPHQLEFIDWAVMRAEFGVAENGAVWLTDAGVKHRAIYFIVQHLALVLPTDQIVHNMHEAYERLTVDGSSLGLFMAGPSKTADIEQSLVIGAHGPRSLTVFCYDAIA